MGPSFTNVIRSQNCVLVLLIRSVLCTFEHVGMGRWIDHHRRRAQDDFDSRGIATLLNRITHMERSASSNITKLLSCAAGPKNIKSNSS